MEEIDVLVCRPPQAFEEPASYRIPTNWILPTTILEKNSISARFFNVDFLRKPRLYQYQKWKGQRSFKKAWRSLFQEGHLKWRYAKKVLNKYHPKILLIIPHHHYNIHTSIFLSKLAKKLLPEIKIVVCNWEPYFNKLLLSNSWVDVIIQAYEDWEPIILKVCKQLLKNKKLNKIPNLVLRRKKKIVSTRKKLVRVNLDTFPIPNRELVIDKKYYPPSSFGHILAGRGCGYQCQFCASASPLRLRNPKLIAKEIAHLYLTYNTRDFAFEITSFTRSKKWAMKVCEEIKKLKLNILFGCYANAIEIDEEILKVMKEAGCWKIAVGFESGSERVLNLMRKPLNLEISLKAATLIKKYGIFLYGGFIIGFPGESIADVRETLKLIRIIKPDMFVLQLFVPHPSTRIFNKLKKEKRLKDEKFWEYTISQIKLKVEKGKKLKKLVEKYLLLTNLCERIIFRKIIFSPKFFFCKLVEYFNYFQKLMRGVE